MAGWLVLLCACQGGLRRVPHGSPRETLSDADHGAVAAAIDAMDALAADPEPDTEIHLALSPTRPATPDDSTRADLLLLRIRAALSKYQDVRVAAADGFEELPASDVKHAVHHLSNWSWARAEARRFDPARPTSLLYRAEAGGTLALIGAMYTAPASASTRDLDQRIPVSLARWHRHVNWCAPASGSGAQWLATRAGSPTFGPRSAVATRESCHATGGVFYPSIYGWMVHVTLIGSDDPMVVWNGELPPSRIDSAHPTDRNDRRAGPPLSAPRQTSVALQPTGPSTGHGRPTPASEATDSPTPSALPTQAPSEDAEAPAGTGTGRIAVDPTPVVAASRADGPVTVPRPPDRLPPTTFAGSRPESNSFMSGQRAVTYDRFMPPGAGRHPVILLLHSDGGLPLQAARFEEMARALARRDYIVEIVHYFDRTGTIAADPAQRMAHLREWVGTVRDAMTDVAHAPRADSTRIGLYGTGLGGTLALVAGAEDPRVRAVVESDGTLPAWAVPTVHRMPAVFIARSATEGSAASRESDRVEAACKAVGAPVENQEYDEASRNGGRMVAKDLRQRGFAFLEQYVMGPAGDQVRRGSR